MWNVSFMFILQREKILLERTVAFRATQKQVVPIVCQPIITRSVYSRAERLLIGFFRSKVLNVSKIPVQVTLAIRTFVMLVRLKSVFYG